MNISRMHEIHQIIEKDEQMCNFEATCRTILNDANDLFVFVFI